MVDQLGGVEFRVGNQINPTENQSLMAIFGVPRGQALYVAKFYASVLRSVASASADIRVMLTKVLAW